MKPVFPVILALALTSPAFTQQVAPFTCHNNDLRLLDPARANDPELLARIAAADAALEAETASFDAASRGGSTYTIPVVFHIIHNNGIENISDAQVEDAIRILNEDFNKLNADWDNVRPEFLNIVGDVGVNFALATKDPQGNCTRGITRTVSALTDDGTQDMKDLIQWPRNKYLNVWTCAYADGAAGYTYTPGTANFFSSGDGIVLLHNYTGAIGTSSPGRSRALTHEVGHWINLSHTWGSSNEPGIATNCNGDDNVSDTPNTIGWTSCNLSGTTCGSLDNVENYMDYSYCSKMFTNGQATRMIAALNSSTAQRNQLWTPSNLSATGVSGSPPLCAAEFTSNSTDICAGSTVQFTDVSYHGVTSRTWTFPGGTPATSTDPTPTVTYNTAGTYPVTLSVSDGSTNLSTTSNNYVTVLANPGAAAPFAEGFEGITTLNGTVWTVDNPENNNTFAWTNAAAYSGSNSVRVVNTTGMADQIDRLISDTYDMSDADQIEITFRYAYAQRNASTNDDRLRLYVSNNCGATWSMRRQLRGSTDLNTAGGVVTSSFVPTQDQWGYAEVNNISSTYYVSDFRFMFEFLSYGGNNVYVDDINLNGTSVGVEELLRGNTSMVVVPNPASGSAQVVLDLASSGPVSLELLDVAGRTLDVVHSGYMAGGMQRIDLPITDLRSGMYLLRLQRNDRSEVVRFTVQ